MVGAGKLGTSQSPVIRVTPVWRSELIRLAETYFNRENKTGRYVVGVNPLNTVEDVNDSTAVLFWKDGNCLEHIHTEVSIYSGMIVYHGNYMDSTLDWLPRATCKVFPNIHSNLALSKHSWLLDETEFRQ